MSNHEVWKVYEGVLIECCVGNGSLFGLFEMKRSGGPSGESTKAKRVCKVQKSNGQQRVKDMLHALGYTEFRGKQEEAIRSVLEGLDVLVLMPTGGGKSLCYALPAMLLTGITIVVSPLIALMEDQTSLMRGKNIPTDYFSANRTSSEKDSILADLSKSPPKLKLLYVTPELLDTKRFNAILRSLYSKGHLSLVAIDEAHCISSWGHDFRPAYRKLSHIRREFPTVPIMALTATASRTVQRDILESLSIPNADVLTSSFNRPNIHYSVVYLDVIQKDAFGVLQELLQKDKDGNVSCAIVYVLKKETATEVAGRLQNASVACKAYHGGLTKHVRTEVLNEWQNDQIKVVIATVAFGMGINKPDVRLVVHYNLPKTLDGFYQESGRAGRDGLPAKSVMLYSLDDRHRMDFILGREVKQAKASRKESQLQVDTKEARHAVDSFQKVVGLCTSLECRRKLLLNHFGEFAGDGVCKLGCDACKKPAEIEQQLETLRVLAFEGRLKKLGGQRDNSSEAEEGGPNASTGNGSETSGEDDADADRNSAVNTAERAINQSNNIDEFFSKMAKAEQEYYSKPVNKDESVMGKLSERMEEGCSKRNIGKQGITQVSAKTRDRALNALKGAISGNTKLDFNPEQVASAANSIESEMFRGVLPKSVYLSQIACRVRHLRNANMADLEKYVHKNKAQGGPVSDLISKIEKVEQFAQILGSSDGGDVEFEMRHAWDELHAIEISCELLTKCDAGKRVRKLRKHPNKTVANAAQGVVEKWRRTIDGKARSTVCHDSCS